MGTGKILKMKNKAAKSNLAKATNLEASQNEIRHFKKLVPEITDARSKILNNYDSKLNLENDNQGVNLSNQNLKKENMNFEALGLKNNQTAKEKTAQFVKEQENKIM